MIISIIVLFLSVMAGGLSVRLFGYKAQNIREPLVFAGAFLFTITIIHILPEVFTQSVNPFKTGVYVLLGFFFQQLLEYFTAGVEHGHLHGHHGNKSRETGLVLGLTVHALMEGLLLNHESPFHERHESYSLLLGIALHHIPAAFALMAVFKTGSNFTAKQWIILILFALATPAGLLLSNFALQFSSQALIGLFAFVSGGFLHISTTIFVETSPEHQLKIRRIAITILGALLAVAVELVN